MRHGDFAAFILTHGRPDNIKTEKSLRSHGYTGRVFLVCDTDDERLDEYRARFGKRVLVFNKRDVDCDTGWNRTDAASPLQARNACFDFARLLGLRYFVELDDDYSRFDFRIIRNGTLPGQSIRRLDFVFDAFLDFLDCDERIATVSFAQAGDFIGGAESCDVRSEKFYRKAMNVFFCRTDRPIGFRNIFNDDVSTYVYWGGLGRIFTQCGFAAIVQGETQQHAGGITEAYRKFGTFTKSFFTVMVAPSCVKVQGMGETHYRMHHKIDWPRCFPKILSEKWRRT